MYFHNEMLFSPKNVIFNKTKLFPKMLFPTKCYCGEKLLKLWNKTDGELHCEHFINGLNNQHKYFTLIQIGLPILLKST